MLRLTLTKKRNHVFPTSGNYEIVYADPPWSYKDQKCNGNASDHYSTMDLKAICDLPVANITAENAVLFLWATYPLIREALEVMAAWGFEYKTIGFQWVKLNRSGKGRFFGLGRWTRGNTECCLLGVKGKPARVSASVSQLIESPLGRHSEKPAEAREKIVELMGPLPRIELFARTTAPGWDCWGDDPGLLK